MTHRVATMPLSTPARKLDIREANEARILRAAEKTFALHGFRGTTTESIAREAGLPKANVHYYFGTKANLYREVLKGILEDWMQAAAAFEAEEDPEGALRSYITAKMQFSRQRPFGSRVWASEIMRGAPVMERFLGTTLKGWVNARVKTIRSWISSGKIQPVDPECLLYMIWAVTQHYADFERQMVILNSGIKFDEEQYREKVEAVVRLVLGSVGIHAQVSANQRTNDRATA
jgi:TetR/AcrR family transcriptional regulator